MCGSGLWVGSAFFERGGEEKEGEGGRRREEQEKNEGTEALVKTGENAPSVRPVTVVARNDDIFCGTCCVIQNFSYLCTRFRP